MRTSDIAIVGGGLGGTAAAVVLGRAGYRVTLIDLHTVYPPDFRAEQLVGSQTEMLRRLGVLDGIVAGVRPVGPAVTARLGRVLDLTDTPHYGLRYNTMVNAARALLPPSVDLLAGRAVDVRADGDGQSVVLATGEAVQTRLVVVATGPGNALLRQLGIGRRIVRSDHSVTIGFDIAPAAGERFDFPLWSTPASAPLPGSRWLTGCAPTCSRTGTFMTAGHGVSASSRARPYSPPCPGWRLSWARSGFREKSKSAPITCMPPYAIIARGGFDRPRVPDLVPSDRHRDYAAADRYRPAL